VKSGCVAATGIDYYQLGIQTGKMAAKILKGEAKAQDMPFEVISEPSLYINTAVAATFEVSSAQPFTISEEMLASAETFDEITVGE
jgi:putative ABC transport system substrate-binding protein